jgi:DNA-binding MarR family transcriptional regulator
MRQLIWKDACTDPRPKAAVIPLDSSRDNEYIEIVPRDIQAEIKQTKPFSSLEDEAVVSLQRTADQLNGCFSDMLKPHGLSPTQFNALRILRGAGKEGRACSEIAERMINRDPDITRLLDRLERRGLVIRSREGRDRRVIIARITQEGLELLRGLDRPIEDFNRKLLGHLGEPQLRTLIKLLDIAREKEG